MNSDLRSWAEALLNANPKGELQLSNAEMQKLFHELSVQRTKLQLQSEELIRTTRELQSSRDAYAELYHTAPVGYFACDHAGVVTQANQTLAKMLCVRCEELEGRQFSDYVASNSQDEWFLHRRELLGGASKLCSELELQPVNGAPIHAQLDYKLHPGNSDTEWHCMGTVTDITPRWIAELELDRLYQNLEKIVEKRTIELQENRKELRKLTIELLLSEQSESQRIAEILHDDIGQLIGSALIRIKLLRKEDLPLVARQNAEAAYSTLELILRQTRNLTFELSCPLVDELGLDLALEELCKSMTLDHGVCFKYNSNHDLLPLPLDRKVLLFRAVRELLTNVLKHADAQNTTVELAWRKTEACIRVEDDGCGFDASIAGQGFSPSGGYGLFSLQESIQHIGGMLEIESAPNAGTRVSISLPIKDTS